MNPRQITVAAALIALGMCASLGQGTALLGADAPAPIGIPQPDEARRTREIAAYNRQQAMIAITESKRFPDPAKAEMLEEGRIKEELVAALEGLADAQEKGDNPKIHEFNKKQIDLSAQCLAADGRSRAARQEVTLRDTMPVTRLKQLAKPLDMAHVEQFEALRERAADAWANYRKVSKANPDGRGVFSAQMGAMTLTLAADRHQKIVKLQLEASKLRGIAEKSDTPDLVKKLADEIERMAKDVGENLQKQNELKVQEEELNNRTKSLLSEARAFEGK